MIKNKILGQFFGGVEKMILIHQKQHSHFRVSYQRAPVAQTVSMWLLYAVNYQ